MDECSITGCHLPIFVKSRGWCRRHYYRWWNHGDPLAAAYTRDKGTDLQRWWAKVDTSGDCWLWTGSLDKGGYGQFDTIADDGKHTNHRAHRWGFIQLVRDLRDEEELDHVCRVHACVRPHPKHLEPVTHAENVARGNAGNHNAAKTHCKQGHEFTPENTYINPSRGGRECRACNKATAAERTRRYREKKRRQL